MADHVRKQLRSAVKTAVTGLATTAARVYDFRVNPLQAAELPGLVVYASDDEAGAETIHAPSTYGRTVTVHVVGYAAANAALDDTLDQIGKEVEAALGVALTVASKTVYVHYTGCTKEFAAGEKQAGSIDMTFNARLFTAANAPDVLL